MTIRRRAVVAGLGGAILAGPAFAYMGRRGGKGQPVIPPVPIIATATLSNQSFTGGAADGTVVGAISVAMSPVSPAFTGTLAIGGLDAASFKLSSSTLPSNLLLNGSQPGGNYSITLIATQVGISNSPATFGPFAITGVSAGSIIASVVLRNTDSAPSPTTTYIEFGHPFTQEVVPAGQHIVASIAGTPVTIQQDRETYWPDGALRWASLKCNVPSIAAGGTAVLDLAAASGAPTRTLPGSATVASVLSDLSSNHAFSMTIANLTRNIHPPATDGSGAFTWLASTQLAFGDGGTDTDTVNGATVHRIRCEVTDTGPVSLRVRVWGPFTDNTGGANHKHLIVIGWYDCRLDPTTGAILDVGHVHAIHQGWMGSLNGTTPTINVPGLQIGDFTLLHNASPVSGTSLGTALRISHHSRHFCSTTAGKPLWTANSPAMIYPKFDTYYWLTTKVPPPLDTGNYFGQYARMGGGHGNGAGLTFTWRVAGVRIIYGSKGNDSTGNSYPASGGITFGGGGGGAGAVAAWTATAGVVTGTSVSVKGSGYTTKPTAAASGGNGYANFDVQMEIDTLSGIAAPGVGYHVNDVLTPLSGDGTQGTVTVATVDGNGGILTATVTTRGLYDYLPCTPLEPLTEQLSYIYQAGNRLVLGTDGNNSSCMGRIRNALSGGGSHDYIQPINGPAAQAYITQDPSFVDSEDKTGLYWGHWTRRCLNEQTGKIPTMLEVTFTGLGSARENNQLLGATGILGSNMTPPTERWNPVTSTTTVGQGYVEDTEGGNNTGDTMSHSPSPCYHAYLRSGYPWWLEMLMQEANYALLGESYGSPARTFYSPWGTVYHGSITFITSMIAERKEGWKWRGLGQCLAVVPTSFLEYPYLKTIYDRNAQCCVDIITHGSDNFRNLGVWNLENGIAGNYAGQPPVLSHATYECFPWMEDYLGTARALNYMLHQDANTLTWLNHYVKFLQARAGTRADGKNMSPTCMGVYCVPVGSNLVSAPAGTGYVGDYFPDFDSVPDGEQGGIGNPLTGPSNFRFAADGTSVTVCPNGAPDWDTPYPIQNGDMVMFVNFGTYSAGYAPATYNNMQVPPTGVSYYTMYKIINLTSTGFFFNNSNHAAASTMVYTFNLSTDGVNPIANWTGSATGNGVLGCFKIAPAHYAGLPAARNHQPAAGDFSPYCHQVAAAFGCAAAFALAGVAGADAVAAAFYAKGKAAGLQWNSGNAADPPSATNPVVYKHMPGWRLASSL